MLVILRENIKNLGLTGDIIKVSDGYARNFLLPRRLVTAADQSNVRELEHHKRVLAKKRAAQKAEIEKYAQTLDGFKLTILRKVGKKDKLFGSVGVNDILMRLKKEGFDIEKSWIKLDDSLKTLGVHPVEIRFQSDVAVTVQVEIAKEAAPEKPDTKDKKGKKEPKESKKAKTE